MVLAVPAPADVAIPQAELERHLSAALAEGKAKGIVGKAVTPFLLGELVRRSEGKTLAANLGLLENNARMAAKIERRALCVAGVAVTTRRPATSAQVVRMAT